MWPWLRFTMRCAVGQPPTRPPQRAGIARSFPPPSSPSARRARATPPPPPRTAPLGRGEGRTGRRGARRVAPAPRARRWHRRRRPPAAPPRPEKRPMRPARLEERASKTPAGIRARSRGKISYEEGECVSFVYMWPCRKEFDAKRLCRCDEERDARRHWVTAFVGPLVQDLKQPCGRCHCFFGLFLSCRDERLLSLTVSKAGRYLQFFLCE